MSYWANRCVKVLAGSYVNSAGVVVSEDKECVTVRIVCMSGFDKGYRNIIVNKNDVQTID